MHRKNHRGALRLGALAGAALLLVAFAVGVPPKPASASEAVFAVIDGETVTESQFKFFLIQLARSKFYHRVPDGGLEAVTAEATEALIQQRLLAHEATRRGLRGDIEAVERQLARQEARYKDTEAWAQIQENLPGLRAALLERSKISALEEQVRQGDDPVDEELKAFYKSNIDLFTEPARAKLQVILIGVPPWENAGAWDKARQTAGSLAAEIIAGASFAEKARAHSTHVSAEQGGKLGFVHSGMLSAPAQEAVDRLSQGEVSTPVRVLEGYTLFRLEDRSRPQIRDFADVRDRVTKLYQREQSDARWNEFLADLRSSAKIVMPADGGKAQTE